MSATETATVWSAWLGTALAFIALCLSAWSIRQSHRTAERTTKLGDKGAEIAQAQAKLAQQSWTDEFFREISDWASEVAHCLSTAIHKFDQNDVDEKWTIEVLINLSGAIDTGRWFFPNVITDQFGSDKPPAYQGYRQPILDWLVRAYQVVEMPSKFDDPKAELITVQRNFVSQIQSRLDPREREKAIARILREFEGIGELDHTEPPKAT